MGGAVGGCIGGAVGGAPCLHGRQLKSTHDFFEPLQSPLPLYKFIPDFAMVTLALSLLPAALGYADAATSRNAKTKAVAVATRISQFHWFCDTTSALYIDSWSLVEISG